MEFTSFLTSLSTSFFIFLILMFLFTWLSAKPGNDVVYYPNRILKGLDPGLKTRNPISWIKEAILSTEDDIVAMSGVDTAVYFVFLSTVLAILVISGIVLLPMLLPLSITDRSVRMTNTTSNGTFDQLDQLSMGHVGEGSPRLWAYVIGVYLVSLATYYLLWNAYKHVSRLRATTLMSPEVRAEQFAILVRDIPNPPKGETRKEQVDSYFRSIYPDKFFRSMVFTDTKELTKIWDELECYRKKLARAESLYLTSKAVGNHEGLKPTNRVGLLGLYGEKVDTIDFYNQKINELIPILESAQKTTLRERQLSSALVFFSCRAAAASAAQCVHAPMVDTWTVMEAPEPRQLIWRNLSLNFYEREVRKYMVYFLVVLIIAFYVIPIGLISAFTTLKNLMKILPFIKPVVEISLIRTVLEAYLPQVALIVFLALLPKLLMFLSKVEGIPSESHVERATSGKYFYFSVLNVFIGVTLGGTLFSTFQEVEDHPNSIVSLLAASLPENATFFLTYVALKFFVGYGLELSRIIPLMVYHLRKKYLCKTEAELKEAWCPGDIGYATRVPGDMLIITIVLCYSVIAPLIIPFGITYFALGWLVLRNQALKVYVPAYESNGRMWPHMHTRIVCALLLYQLTMLGYFGVKKFVYTPILFTLPIATIIFSFICTKKFYRFFEHNALEVASRELKEAPNMEHVYVSFLPMCLRSDKVDYDHLGDV